MPKADPIHHTELDLVPTKELCEEIVRRSVHGAVVVAETENKVYHMYARGDASVCLCHATKLARWIFEQCKAEDD